MGRPHRRRESLGAVVHSPETVPLQARCRCRITERDFEERAQCSAQVIRNLVNSALQDRTFFPQLFFSQNIRFVSFRRLMSPEKDKKER